jgi:cell division protein FtsJ
VVVHGVVAAPALVRFQARAFVLLFLLVLEMVKSNKDKRDLFFRQSKADGYRARSAYKLLHVDEQYDILSGVKRAVDLCAAPGSWSQVLAKRLTDSDALIVAVDLQNMAPIPRVVQLCGDITLSSTAQSILSHFNQMKADLVLCDGAPEVTGLRDLDEFMQSSLLLSAIRMVTAILRPGGTFVSKLFAGPNVSFHQEQLELLFHKVILFKPPSSRSASAEHFFICKDFGKWPLFKPEWLISDPSSDKNASGDLESQSTISPSNCQHRIAFLRSGSLNPTSITSNDHYI